MSESKIDVVMNPSRRFLLDSLEAQDKVIVDLWERVEALEEENVVLQEERDAFRNWARASCRNLRAVRLEAGL